MDLPQPPREDVVCRHDLLHEGNQDVCQLHDIADQIKLQVLMNMWSAEPCKVWISLHGHVPTPHVQLVKQVQPLIGELVLLQQEVDLLFIIAQCAEEVEEERERLL